MALDVAYLGKAAISWGDILFRITLPDHGNVGGRLFGFQKMSGFGQKRERELVKGQNASQAPIAVSKGEYTPPKPKIIFLAHSLDADETAPFDSLTTLLKRYAPDGRSYGDVKMSWLLQVNARGLRCKYQWFDVYMEDDGGDWESSPTGLVREVTFICTRMKTNGGTLYDSSQE